MASLDYVGGIRKASPPMHSSPIGVCFRVGIGVCVRVVLDGRFSLADDQNYGFSDTSKFSAQRPRPHWARDTARSRLCALVSLHAKYRMLKAPATP